MRRLSIPAVTLLQILLSEPYYSCTIRLPASQENSRVVVEAKAPRHLQVHVKANSVGINAQNPRPDLQPLAISLRPQHLASFLPFSLDRGRNRAQVLVLEIQRMSVVQLRSLQQLLSIVMGRLRFRSSPIRIDIFAEILLREAENFQLLLFLFLHILVLDGLLGVGFYVFCIRACSLYASFEVLFFNQLLPRPNSFLNDLCSHPLYSISFMLFSVETGLQVEEVGMMEENGDFFGLGLGFSPRGRRSNLLGRRVQVVLEADCLALGGGALFSLRGLHYQEMNSIIRSFIIFPELPLQASMRTNLLKKVLGVRPLFSASLHGSFYGLSVSRDQQPPQQDQQFLPLPKSSFFSDYMGLTKQLSELRKESMKEEARAVRSNGYMFALSFVVFGFAYFLMIIDKKSQPKIEQFKLKLRVSLGFTPSSRKDALRQLLKNLDDYLQKYPNYSFDVVDTCAFAAQALRKVSFSRRQEEEEMLRLCESVYSRMIKGSAKIRHSLIFKEACQAFLEQCFPHHGLDNDSIPAFLLSYGSIKQQYLSMRCLVEARKSFSRFGEAQRALMTKNCMKAREEKEEYFKQIFSSTHSNETQVPQLYFKEEVQKKWLQQVMQFMNTAA